jgi:hypothetical protein
VKGTAPTKTSCLRACLTLFLCSMPLLAQSTKPKINVASDGFPAGRNMPEGAASDLARSYIRNDVQLFAETCIGVYAHGQAATQYDEFMRSTITKLQQAAKQRMAGIAPSQDSPKRIRRVFAARHLTGNGPASYGYAAFNFQDVMFVDVLIEGHSGKTALTRTLVIQEPDGNWYAHPAPYLDPLLSHHLQEESASLTDFSKAYDVQKP